MQDNGTSIANLPQDIIRGILDNLYLRDARQCRFISKSWHDLATMYGFKTVGVLIDEDQKRLVKRAQTLKNVRRRKFHDPFLRHLQPCFHYVEGLVICIVGTPRPNHEKAVLRGLHKLFDAIVSFQRLRSIRIVDNNIELSHRISARHLVVEELFHARNEALRCPSLDTLEFMRYRTQAPCFDYDRRLLYGIRNLTLAMDIMGGETHNFWDSGRPNKFFRCMPDMILNHCKNLTSLHLGCNRYWGWYPSCPSLYRTNFPNLRVLRLVRHIFHNDDQVEWIAAHKHLDNLTLSRCPILAGAEVHSLSPDGYYEGPPREPPAQTAFVSYMLRWSTVLDLFCSKLKELRSFKLELPLHKNTTQNLLKTYPTFAIQAPGSSIGDFLDAEKPAEYLSYDCTDAPWSTRGWLHVADIILDHTTWGSQEHLAALWAQLEADATAFNNLMEVVRARNI